MDWSGRGLYGLDGGNFSIGSESLDFIFSAVIFPLKRLEIADFIASALRNWDDVIDFPAVAASKVAIILPNDGPAPGIEPQDGGGAHRARFLPDRFDDFIAERLS